MYRPRFPALALLVVVACSPAVTATRSGGQGAPSCPAQVPAPEPYDAAAKVTSKCANDGALACLAACDAGNAADCTRAAHLLEADPAEADRAFELYDRACRLGDHNACTNYGATVVSRDGSADAALQCAYRLFERGCGAGEPFACGMQAFCLASGQGAPSDGPRARRLAEQSCQRLGLFPCAVHGLFLENAGELAQAQQAYARACETGYSEVCADAERLRATTL